MQHGRRKYTAGLMLKFNEEKLSKLRTFEDHLREEIGEPGSEARKDFDARAKAWYYAELLKDERKKQKMTQKALCRENRQEERVCLCSGKGPNGYATLHFLENSKCFRAAILAGSRINASS